MKFIKTDSVLSKALSLLTAVMMMVSSFGVSFMTAPSQATANAGADGEDTSRHDIIKDIIKRIKEGEIPTDVNICYASNYDLEVNFGDQSKTIPFSELIDGSKSAASVLLKIFIKASFSPCDEGGNENPGGDGNTEGSANLHVTKIICNDPRLIPSWGHGDHENITSDTAGSFLSSVNTENEENCWIDSDWKFQWSRSDASNPGDNTGADENWTTIYGSNNTIPQLYFGESNSIWVREVYNSDYVPFLGQVTTKGEGQVSAGLYCHTDGLHYDNYDRVDGLEVDGDYYCVAFNALVKEPAQPSIGTIDVCKITLDAEGKEIGIPEGTTFTIPGLTQSQVGVDKDGQPVGVNGPFRRLPDTVLTSGITGKSMKVGGTEYKNVQCESHNITERGNYYYGEETMNSTGAVVQWEAPRYNDRNTSAPTVYDSSLVDGDKTGTDSSRDTNADGHIKFEGGKRTLIVLNQMKGKGGEPTDPQTATVQLCKVDDNGHNLSGWELSLTSAEPIDTVTVAPDGTTVQSEVLDAGTYLLKASDTYNYRKVGSEGSLADAAFSNRTQKEQNEKGYSEWLLSSGTSSKHLGLQVDNDGALGWGSVFNSGNEYSQVVTLSSDRAIDFLITDNNYKDNSGTLKVEVYRVFSDVTGENGCVSIEGVPFGQYVPGEVMQTGWTNVRGIGEAINIDGDTTITVVNKKTDNGENPDRNAQLSLGGLKFHNSEGKTNPRGDYHVEFDKLPGWTFNLYKENESGEWVFVKATTTDSAGNYNFKVRGAGVYHVCEEMQSGWEQVRQDRSGTPYHIVTDNVSPNAEIEGPYCSTTVFDGSKNHSTKKYFGNIKTSSEPSITLNTTKIVCDYEEDLPNWQGTDFAKNITRDSALALEEVSEKSCSEVTDWQFQWASGTVVPTVSGGYVGYLDDEKWTTISTGTTTIPLASLESEAISVREVLQEGYIPFTYDESNRDNENDVTAELYCSGDGLNYDNLEWVRDLKDGDTVECVAFNAPLPNEGGGGPSNDGGFTTSSRTRTGGFVPTSTVGEILGDSTSIHEGEVLGAADSFPGMPDSGNESQNLIGLIMALQVLLMTAGAFYMKRRMTFWQS